MKVLVIIDMQNDFTTGILGNKECIAVIPEVIKAIENGDYDKVYLTRDTHKEDYMNTQEGKKLPVAHTLLGTRGWNIVESIAMAVEDKFNINDIMYINKPTFGSKELQAEIENLYKCYGKNLVIDFVGVCTGICVISNAIPAKMNAPEAIIRVLPEACACVTPESHRNAIEAMRMCQIDIADK